MAVVNDDGIIKIDKRTWTILKERRNINIGNIVFSNEFIGERIRLKAYYYDERLQKWVVCKKIFNKEKDEVLKMLNKISDQTLLGEEIFNDCIKYYEMFPKKTHKYKVINLVGGLVSSVIQLSDLEQSLKLRYNSSVICRLLNCRRDSIRDYYDYYFKRINGLK